jgi:hypothetical protein
MKKFKIYSNKSYLNEPKIGYFKHWVISMKLSITYFINGWFPNILKEYISTFDIRNQCYTDVKTEIPDVLANVWWCLTCGLVNTTKLLKCRCGREFIKDNE